MKTKILTWDRVDYHFRNSNTDDTPETGSIILTKLNSSCDSADNAISNFCYWLNSGALNSHCYAVKSGEHIILFRKSFKDNVPDKEINRFFDFDFYDTSKEYNGKDCPAFKLVYTEKIKERI